MYKLKSHHYVHVKVHTYSRLHAKFLSRYITCEILMIYIHVQIKNLSLCQLNEPIKHLLISKRVDFLRELFKIRFKQIEWLQLFVWDSKMGPHKTCVNYYVKGTGPLGSQRTWIELKQTFTKVKSQKIHKRPCSFHRLVPLRWVKFPRKAYSGLIWFL